MSQTENEASDPEQGALESGSVFDFLYHDVRRVGSFLAQFDDSGHLQQVTQAEGSQRGAKRSWRASISADFLGLGDGEASLERGPRAGGFETAERIYDPLWTNACTLLDFLEERSMLQHDLTSARIDQFVLITGSLNILDLPMVKDIWEVPILRKMILSTATPPALPPGATSAQRAAHKQQAELAKNGYEAVIQVLKFLPHAVHAWLQTRDGNYAWSSLRDDALIVSTADLLLKHGASISGTWSMLGVLDALPEAKPGENFTPNVLPDPAAALNPMLAENPMSQILVLLSPIVRQLGRPNQAYGLTPLLIFREIHP